MPSTRRARRRVGARIAAAGAALSPAERRVAAVVEDDPKLVAFGTVADLAARSRTSGPTVLRCAAKLGFSGFAALQAAVQAEIADALAPAAQRIRERPPGDIVERALEAEVANVRASLEGIDPDELAAVVDLLADRRRAIHVLAGDASRGVAALFVTQLDLLRDDVHTLDGSPVRTARQLAAVRAGDAVVAIDHRRYDAWVLERVDAAADLGALVVTITDSTLSPLAQHATRTLVAAGRGVGPFDSHTGTLAVLQLLVAATAARLRRSAAERLDAVERAWRDGGALVDR